MKFIFHKILNKFIYRPLLKMQLKKVGNNFRLGYLSEILNPQYFEFGKNFYCGPFAFFGTNKNYPVIIGNYVMFGPRCIIQGGNHDTAYEGFMYNNQSIDHFKGEIKIEDGVWVGCDTTILSGTKIGEGSIIGAKSLVNKKIPPYVVAGGVPVKILKQRFKTELQLQNTLKITNSKYTLDYILKLHSGLGYTYK